MDGANRIQGDSETQVGERATEENTGDKHGVQDAKYVEGGYGWAIVLSCFLQSMLMDGVINAFGVIYFEVTETFNASSAEAAWILSLQTCIMGLVGPGVTFLMEMTSARVTVIVGSLLLSLGILLSAFTPNVYTLYLTFGFIAGTGFGVFEQISMGLVNYYFNTRRGIANGITNTGTAAGTVFFPPLTNYLFAEYGYRDTCILLSAIALHGVIAGVLIISPQEAQKLSSKSVSTDHNDSELKKTADSGVTPPAKGSEADGVDLDGGCIDSFTASTSLAKSATKSNITPAADKASLNSNKFASPANKLCIDLRTACDFSLFRDYKFTFFVVAHCLFSGSYLVPSGFMPARAVSYGISKTDASLLISAMGIASLVSRPLCGLLVDRQPIKRFRYYVFIIWTALAGGLSLVSFGPSLEAQMTYAVVYGIAQGNYNSMITLSLSDLIGVQKLMTAYGLASMCMVVTNLLIPSASGLILDATGRYEYVYLFSGSLLLMAALSLSAIPLIECVKNKFSKDD